jgi:hypothetical protein
MQLEIHVSPEREISVTAQVEPQDAVGNAVQRITDAIDQFNAWKYQAHSPNAQ